MWEAVEDGTSTQKPSALVLSSRWTKEKPGWASETFRGCQTRAIMNLGKAFQALWRGNAKYPTFHKKGRKDSFYVDNGHAYISGNRIHLPNIGKVRLAEPLRFNGKIIGYTVSGYAGQWHVSVQVDTQDAMRPCLAPDSVVGIDIGLNHIAVASDGTICDTPKSLKRLHKKLKDRQRALARTRSRSNNHRKLLKKKQKVQLRIDNIRQDVAHKFTSRITKSHGIVVVEDLDLKGMMDKAQYKSMRRSLTSSMMGTILQQLSYKSLQLKKADRSFPSTKTCSSCGSKKDSIGLNERVYSCEHCGAVLDRDLNAALNLMKLGMVNPDCEKQQ